MELSNVTIVVPTKNEAHNIECFCASIPPEVMLILVDASTDDTRQRVAQLRPNRTLIISSTLHIAPARHLGAQIASTPWLLFTDADIHFAPDYFTRLQSLGAGDALYGAKLSQDEFQGFYRSFRRWQGIFDFLGVPAASGSNLLIRRAAYFQVGGFDLVLRVNEDTEIGWRLKRAGCQVTFAPELVVYAHDHRRLRKGAWRKNLHSLLRCTLLYFNLIPPQRRSDDWGYWSAS